MSFSIYMIRNTISDKVYVGETTMPFEDRIASHKRMLAIGRHAAQSLQSDWNTLGEKTFEFTLLRHYPDNHSLGERRHIERNWMERLQAFDPKHGYNTTTKGRSYRLY